MPIKKCSTKGRKEALCKRKVETKTADDLAMCGRCRHMIETTVVGPFLRALKTKTFREQVSKNKHRSAHLVMPKH